MSATPVKVLVIDDSAVVRHTVATLLQPSDGWQLTSAPDPVVGLERIRLEPPDVILLDLEMPRMDGLTFLRHIMGTNPIPVVICSGYAEHGTRMAVAALDAGAVEIFPKPKLAVKEFLAGAGESLASVLRQAASAGPSLKRRWRAAAPGDPSVPAIAHLRTRPAPVSTAAVSRWASTGPGATILLGASMGGPDALRRILAGFPADGPACVVVQHMPERFTTAFARRLDETIAMEVREAESGDAVRAGRVLVAPGGRHLVLEGGQGGPVTSVIDGPPVQGHRPSVDLLFESAARVLGSAAVAAVLTGMGEDGADGLLALANAGARTLVQDRASCTVFGMPSAALERGGAERAVPLHRMAALLLELAGEGHTGRGRNIGAD
jgi:two-component system chemotaxis response regulator CheB